MIEFTGRHTWSMDPRAGDDLWERGEVAEVRPRETATPSTAEARVGSLLRALLRAGDAETLQQTLHGVLEACIVHWAACHAMILARSVDGSALAARDGTADGSVEAPALATRYQTTEPELVSVQLAAQSAPREVRALVLSDGAEEVGRLWLVFARQGAAPEGADLGWIIPAVVMTLRRVRERLVAQQREHRLQRRIDEGERRLATVLESVTDPMLVIEDRTTRIAYANQAARRRFGGHLPPGADGQPAALVGRTLSDVAFAEQLGEGEPGATVLHQFKSVVNSRRGWVYRVEDHRAARHLRALARQLHRDATVGRLAGATLSDALAAEASLVTALASMQFELFNARFAPSGPGALDGCMTLVDDARDAAGRLRRVLGGVARIGRGEADTPRRIDVVEVIESVLGALEPQLSRYATVVRALAPVPTVTASPGPLGLVVLHLLVNAVHAIADGRQRPHTLRVETRVDGDTVVIAVTDDGCGIPAERLPTVFEPFQSSKPMVVGAGLGLATSREIVERWGGRIDVASEAGIGSTFQVLLPLG